MNIGQASDATGVSQRMIRHYEKIGLIPAPPRRDSGYRDYSASDVHRLRFIANARDLGFPVEEIRTLLALWSEFGNTVVFVTHDVDEAVFLGSRVVVMSASPGRLIADIRVPLPRPRDPAVLTAPEFVDIKRQCLGHIREETLKAFAQANAS